MKAALGDYIKNMPCLPASTARIHEICNNTQTSPADLIRIISLDPVLLGLVLKLVNSAYCGLEQPMISMARAMIMLGINTVKNLAISTAALGYISSKNPSADFGTEGGLGIEDFNIEGFWRHSFCVGVSAKLLATKRGIDAGLAQEYFTAGFLHDIGKLALNAVFSKDYTSAVNAARKKRKSLFKTEEQSLGINHCTAGAMIGAAWKLEGAVKDAVIHHHDCAGYSGAYRDVLYSVAAANCFASSSGIFSGNSFPDPVPPGIWKALNVSREIFQEIEKDVVGEIQEAEGFLKIEPR